MQIVQQQPEEVNYDLIGSILKLKAIVDEIVEGATRPPTYAEFHYSSEGLEVENV